MDEWNFLGNIYFVDECFTWKNGNKTKQKNTKVYNLFIWIVLK